jgi:N-acetyl-alpha-D-muramate 1-phosphate uridylyltransferase
VTLLDQALERLRSVTGELAVNAHYLADQIAAHVGDRAHLSLEPEPLGTAGAVGHLRDWIAGRSVAVANGDSVVWPNPFPHLAADWTGETVRLLVVATADGHPADFEDGRRFAGCSLIPADLAAVLPDGPSGLWEACWRELVGTPRLELVDAPVDFFDCGTFAELAAARAHFGDPAELYRTGA